MAALHTRKDVWELSKQDPWHPTIKWYALAVRDLQSRDEKGLGEPRSWGNLAAIHGTTIPESQWPNGQRFAECQHFTWFFLPWHRIYLHHFEKIVRSRVVKLGGPDDWALPYWNYTETDPGSVRKLPPAFRDPQIPGDHGNDKNPLLVPKRAPRINDGAEVSRPSTRTGSAARERIFTEDGGDGVAGFGGPDTGPVHFGPSAGALERSPHGSIHMAVGGVRPPFGLMSDPDTAALDPIFWLHHANVDRLWDGWLALGGPRANPTDASWLTQSFQFGAGEWFTKMKVADVLDSKAPPLSYEYPDLSVRVATPTPRVAAAAADRGFADVTETEGAEPAAGPREVVGVSDEPVPLDQGAASTDISLEEPSGPLARTAAAGGKKRKPRRIHLKLENVKGRTLSAPLYEVHVNLPPGADPDDYEDRLAGEISMFGVVNASKSDARHSGSGVTFSFDITDIVRSLEASDEWDPKKVRVAVTPVADATGELYPGDVKIGRVSVLYE